MFNNLTLYYLNQMGIRPWIKKETYISKIKLIILSPANTNPKAQSLLGKIIAYLNVDHDHLMHITPNDLPIDNLISQSLTAIWCLGINSESFLTELNYSGPVLSSAALEHVLNNPLSKRDLFQDLNSIKHLLAQN